MQKHNHLSQRQTLNLSKFQTKLQQLDNIQKQLYQRIKQNQELSMINIKQAENNRNKCLKQRPKNIRAQTFQQIVKHPANSQNKGGNGCWMYLANFISQTHDLSDVQKRALQRRQIRQNIQKHNRQIAQQQARKNAKFQGEEYEYDLKGNMKKSKTKKNRKIPFNLQRQLHRKQVEQNKKRLQKMQQYKRQNYYQNFNY